MFNDRYCISKDMLLPAFTVETSKAKTTSNNRILQFTSQANENLFAFIIQKILLNMYCNNDILDHILFLEVT